MALLSEELRRRISEMNRTALRDRQVARESGYLPQEVPPQRPAALRFLPLEEAVQGRVLEHPPSRFLVIEKPLEDFCRSAEEFTDHFSSWCRRLEPAQGEGDPDRVALADIHPSSWVFLDIETCGLTNSCVFLVGLFYFRDGQFHLEQLLARDYGEEAAMLHYLAQRMADFRLLLTFNGKSFDWPFLMDRSSIYGVSLADCERHIDVLHAARKRWRDRLPNCKLQTLERYVCKRARYGDIPGSLIPEAYHEFVKTGDARQMRDILHHNALDLFTTSEITLHLFRGGDADSL